MKRPIDLMLDKCNDILKKEYHNENITLIISERYKQGYILTLCHGTNNRFSDNQSEPITLDTDIEQLIELLYNRTM